ncbi:MAG: lysophospholipid acyltransferase family protein [Candidatus Aminicenantes bacterium]|nr:lysophospholipid acyltransferase family protein [Candidatus Aminicenantes bacterium]
MQKFKDIIISAVIWFLFSLTFLVWTFILLIASFFTTGKFFEYLGKLLCRTVLLVTGIRVHRQGFENIEPGKQYVIMMNHISLFDPFIFTANFPGRFLAFQEQKHFRWILYGWIMRKMGHIAIRRDIPRKAVEDLKKGPEVLRKRKDFSLIIFPEGTRSLTGKLGAFKRGAFLMTLDAGVDILPIIQIGGFRIKQKKGWLIRPGKLELIVEKPIPTHGYTKENAAELMEKTRALFLKYVK